MSALHRISIAAIADTADELASQAREADASFERGLRRSGRGRGESLARAPESAP